MNTITIPVTMAGVFAEVLYNLEQNGLSYTVETTVRDFIISVTGDK